MTDLDRLDAPRDFPTFVRERFGGTIKHGSHTPNGAACFHEAVNLYQGKPWSDDTTGTLSLVSLNDAPWSSDEARTLTLRAVAVRVPEKAPELVAAALRCETDGSAWAALAASAAAESAAAEVGDEVGDEVGAVGGVGGAVGDEVGAVGGEVGAVGGEVGGCPPPETLPDHARRRGGHPMTDDLDRLDALAAAATPGPWVQSHFVDGREYEHMSKPWKDARQAEEVRMVRAGGAKGQHVALAQDPWNAEADAAFIAACDPATVRSLVAALNKINDIRNSIVGSQQLNWSEHIYPLVAALNEAGVKGLDYPESKENFGTLIEQRDAAVRERDELQRILDYVWNVAAIERIRVVGNDGVAIHVHDLFGPDDPLTEGVRAALHSKDGAS